MTVRRSQAEEGSETRTVFRVGHPYQFDQDHLVSETRYRPHRNPIKAPYKPRQLVGVSMGVEPPPIPQLTCVNVPSAQPTHQMEISYTLRAHEISIWWVGWAVFIQRTGQLRDRWWFELGGWLGWVVMLRWVGGSGTGSRVAVGPRGPLCATQGQRPYVGLPPACWARESRTLRLVRQIGEAVPRRRRPAVWVHGAGAVRTTVTRAVRTAWVLRIARCVGAQAGSQAMRSVRGVS